MNWLQKISSIPDWVRQGIIDSGRTPDRIFNPIDVQQDELGKSLLENDPITEFLKRKNPKLVDRARCGDLTKNEIRLILQEMQKENL